MVDGTAAVDEGGAPNRERTEDVATGEVRWEGCWYPAMLRPDGRRLVPERAEDNAEELPAAPPDPGVPVGCSTSRKRCATGAKRGCSRVEAACRVSEERMMCALRLEMSSRWGWLLGSGDGCGRVCRGRWRREAGVRGGWGLDEEEVVKAVEEGRAERGSKTEDMVLCRCSAYSATISRTCKEQNQKDLRKTN